MYLTSLTLHSDSTCRSGFLIRVVNWAVTRLTASTSRCRRLRQHCILCPCYCLSTLTCSTRSVCSVHGFPLSLLFLHLFPLSLPASHHLPASLPALLPFSFFHVSAICPAVLLFVLGAVSAAMIASTTIPAMLPYFLFPCLYLPELLDQSGYLILGDLIFHLLIFSLISSGQTLHHVRR